MIVFQLIIYTIVFIFFTLYKDYIIEGKSINLKYIDLENMSELNAISIITDEVQKKYNIELDISEAREIFQRIKFSKT